MMYVYSCGVYLIAVKKDAQVEVANEKKGKKVKDLRVLDAKSAMNLCKCIKYM